MTFRKKFCLLSVLAACSVLGQDAAPAGPDPREIPIPEIKTALAPLPGVKDLPVRNEMPDVLTMNDGTKVRSARQWQKRREEMRKILAWYAVGQMPPAPGNVKGKEVSSEKVLDGSVNYRLIHLTFGPGEKLGLDIGVFTPVRSPPSFCRPARCLAQRRCRVYPRVQTRVKVRTC